MEAVVIAPVLFLMVFGLLQLGQLGLGILITNYSAGSTARKLSRTTSLAPDATMQADYASLQVAGLKNGNLETCQNTSGKDVSSGVTSDVIVIADAHISAFPIVGPLFNTINPAWLLENAKWKMQTPCLPGPVPTVGFTGPPDYEFIVRGSALARKNYL